MANKTVPLLDTEDLPLPFNGSALELDSGDGTTRVAYWRTEELTKKGSVLFVHGLCECIEKHAETYRRFLNRGCNVVALDLAGHGLSSNPSSSGMLDFARYDEGIDAATSILSLMNFQKPWLIAGHSMGGCLALSAAHRLSDQFKGAFLSAPMLGVQRFDKRPQLEKISKILSFGKISPFSRWPVFKASNYTSDATRLAQNISLLLYRPELRARVASLPWARGAFKRLDELFNADWVYELKLPVFIATAEKDTLVSNDQASKFADMLPQCRLVNIPDAQHELLRENDEVLEHVWSHIDDLIKRASSAF